MRIFVVASYVLGHFLDTWGLSVLLVLSPRAQLDSRVSNICMTFCLCYWFFWMTVTELINFCIFLYICAVRSAAHSRAIGINLCKHLEETVPIIYFIFLFIKIHCDWVIYYKEAKDNFYPSSDLLGGRITPRGSFLHNLKCPMPGRQWFSMPIASSSWVVGWSY